MVPMVADLARPGGDTPQRAMLARETRGPRGLHAPTGGPPWQSSLPDSGLAIAVHFRKRGRVSKVFVGNLSFDTTREELEAFFAPMGEIAEIVVPTDRDSGRPRGFAFVTFASSEIAAQAIQQLDGKELGGRNLRVNEASERTDRAPGGGGGGFRAPSFRPGPPTRPKGSRRNIRGRKRSIW